MDGAISAFAAEHDRWILWVPVLVGIGIGAYFSLPAEPAWWLGPVGCAAVIAAGVSARGAIEAAGPFAALVIAGAVAVGFTAAQARTASVEAPVLGARLGPTAVSGRIIRIENLGSRDRITLDRLHVRGLEAEQTPERVRLSLGGEQPRLVPGDEVRVLAVLSPPPPPTAPGAFDFQRQSFFARLGATGFGLGAVEILARRPGERDVLLAGLRSRINAAVRAVVEPQRAALVIALLTGERTAIAPPVLAAIRDAGLAHLLAISGLHIGLVASFLFFAARSIFALIPAIALRRPTKKWAAAIAAAGAGGYAVLAGATIPSQRAFMMVAIVFLGVIFDRQALSMRLVAIAATAVLIAQPESLLGASFQLSFAAVIALIAVYEAVQRRHLRGAGDGVLSRIVAYVFFVALTTVVATLATSAYAGFHFQRLAVFGLPANLLAVPLMAMWIMPLGVAVLAFMPFGLAAPFLWAMGWGVGLVIEIAREIASWPGAVTIMPAMPSWGLAALTFGGLWLCLWRCRWRYFGVVLIIAGWASLAITSPPDILADGRGRLIGVRAPDGGLAFSSSRGGNFERASWLRRAGLRDAARWPEPGLGDGGFMECDRAGCVFHTNDKTVALMMRAEAAADDCRLADVIVSMVPVRGPCLSPTTVIDRFDLWRGGAHAIWIEDDGARVESVNGVRGDRPWVLSPDAAREKTANARKVRSATASPRREPSSRRALASVAGASAGGPFSGRSISGRPTVGAPTGQ